VEDPAEHDLPEQAAKQRPREGLPVQSTGIDERPGGVQGEPIQPLHHQHPLGAQLRVQGRQPHRGVGSGRGRRRCHRGHVARLDAEVEFLAERGGEATGQVDGADGGPPPGAGLQPARHAVHDVQVALDHWPDAGALDLDRHVRSRGAEPGPVHLGDRGGSQGVGVELGEDGVGRGAELLAEHLLYLRPRGRGDLMVEPAELVDEFRGQQVAAGGQ
jgi:hypothetical protein